MTALKKSRIHLQADALTVEKLVNRVKRGEVRVPDFQRPLRWTSNDVLLLFDSIYQGYPIGSFLMRQAYAPADAIQYGPVKINAPESNLALWVVDGQQRLTALAVGLSRDGEMPTTPDDAWVIYFDAKEQTFHTPPRDGVFPSTWVPVTQLLDASALSEWVFNWQHNREQLLRKSVFDAGKLIRQYEIPVYIVKTDEEETLRDIFYRMNESGKRMSWEDVHDALFGHKSDEPSTLNGLANELQSLGVGRPSEDQLLSAIIAFKGLDAARSISDHYRRDPEILRGAVNEALPALRGVLTFLKSHAEIPHLRLLPRALPFTVLTKFFGLYREPNGRTLELLVRWTWRTLLSIKSIHDHTLLRHSLNAIEGSDQEQTMQRLMDVVPRNKGKPFVLPQKFDARSADSRIVLLALNSLNPIDLVSGRLIDVADLIDKHNLDTFRRIIIVGGRKPEATRKRPKRRAEIIHGPSNRIILPPTLKGGVRTHLVKLIEQDGPDSHVLKSHCIDIKAAESLMNRDVEKFLSLRSKGLNEAVDALGSRLAAWDMNDRPSISYILQQTGEEE